MLQRILDEPYRIFFPIGTFLCLLGMLYWPLKIAGIAFTDTPTEFHKHLMIFGFIHAFVTGFLCTAVPRLTRTGPLHKSEFGFILLMYLLLLMGIFSGAYDFTYFDFTLALAALLLVLVRRFWRRQQNPPESFVFMPAAFLCALSGGMLLTALHLEWLKVAVAENYVLGLQLVNEGYLLCLILGVGGFLMRSLFGIAPPLQVSPGNSVTVPTTNHSRRNILAICAVMIVLSYPAGNLLPLRFTDHALYLQKAAFLARALVVMFVAFWQLGIHRNILQSKPVELFLRIAVVCILIGVWIRTLSTSAAFDMSIEHLILAAGFGLATFAVATRVVLSHGGAGSRLQTWSWQLFGALLLLLMGALTRVFAFVIPEMAAHHLAYAALLWSLGVAFWALLVLKNTRPPKHPG